MNRRLLTVVLLLIVVAFVGFMARAARLLVINDPRRADVIVVLAGDKNDRRYWKGMELLRAGKAPRLVVDADSFNRYFGRTPVENAAQFVAETAGDRTKDVSVCPVREDSTLSETRDVAGCVEKLHPQSILLVTSDYHSRRALSIFCRRLPQYQYSMAAAADPYFLGSNGGSAGNGPRRLLGSGSDCCGGSWWSAGNPEGALMLRVDSDVPLRNAGLDKGLSRNRAKAC